MTSACSLQEQAFLLLLSAYLPHTSLYLLSVLCTRSRWLTAGHIRPYLPDLSVHSSKSALELRPYPPSPLGLAAWPWATAPPTRQAEAVQGPPPGPHWPDGPQVSAQSGHTSSDALFPELAGTPCSPQSCAYKGQRGASGHGGLVLVWVPTGLPPSP